jgi:hypothetical protein
MARLDGLLELLDRRIFSTPHPKCGCLLQYRGLFDHLCEADSIAGMGEEVMLEGELLREQAHLWRRYQSDLLSR